MIVAGIGSKAGVGERDVLAAVNAALSERGLSLDTLGALATGGPKRGEKAIQQAAQRLGVPLRLIEDATLQSTSDRCLTRSEKSIAYSGLPSLSEAAALAAAGDGATLLAPRSVHGGVTVALAASPSPLVGEGGSARSADTDEG